MYPERSNLKYLLTQARYPRQLIFFLSIIIGIGVLYGIVPTEYSAVRDALALAQFVFMAITMAITMVRILEDF